MMKAAMLKSPRTICLEQVPIPSADNDFLVVEVKACGICGSDVRYYEGENPWALHTLGKNIPNPPNIILGHEFAGVVHEVKNKEYHHLLGKRVSILAFNSCGVCNFCRQNQYNLCKNTMHIGHGAGWGERDYYPGGMANYCEIWNTHVVELPDSVSYEEATLLDPISVAIHAITKSNIKPGASVLVLGCGAVGLSIAQAVRAYGAKCVICTDLSEFPLRLAKECGIDNVINANSEDVEKCVHDIAGKADVVFDTVGNELTQKQALHLLKESGCLVNLVANNNVSHYSLMDLAGEKTIVTSANNRYEDYLLGLSLIETGIINAKKMITHLLALDEIQKGFDILLDKQQNEVMKIVLIP